MLEFMIPVYCQQVLDGRASQVTVWEFIERLKRLPDRVSSERVRAQTAWESLPLTREELLRVQSAKSLSRDEVESLRKCLRHLRLYATSGESREVRRALTAWEASERYHTLYREERAYIDPMIGDRLARAASSRPQRA